MFKFNASKRKYQKWTAMVILVVFFALLPSLGMADARKRYKQQIDQFRVMLEQTAKLDSQKLTEDDRTDVLKWLEESEVLLAKGDMDAVNMRLKRVEYAMELVQQLTVVSQIQGKALEQEKGHASASEEIEKMKKEIEKLQKQKQKLLLDIKSVQ